MYWIPVAGLIVVMVVAFGAAALRLRISDGFIVGLLASALALATSVSIGPALVASKVAPLEAEATMHVLAGIGYFFMTMAVVDLARRQHVANPSNSTK